jgi:hypothetical protein
MLISTGMSQFYARADSSATFYWFLPARGFFVLIVCHAGAGSRFAGRGPVAIDLSVRPA